MTFTPFNELKPCILCGKTRACAYDSDTNILSCLSTFSDRLPYEFKYDSAGFGIFHNTDPKQDADKYPDPLPINYGKGYGFKSRKNVKQSSATAIAKATLKELTIEYREIFDELTLKSNHRQALIQKRQLTPEQVERSGIRSVGWREQISSRKGIASGFGADGISQIPSGMLIPFRSLKGNIIGYQVAPDSSFCPKYMWTKAWADKERGILQNGNDVCYQERWEKPIGFFGDPTPGKPLYLCEGVLKPTVANLRHGINTMGAAAGHFTGSPKIFKRYIKKLKPSQVIWAADAGTGINEHVNRMVDKAAEFLRNELGIVLQIADWGQLYSKLDGNDIDDISTEKVKNCEVKNYNIPTIRLKSLESSVGRTTDFLLKAFKSNDIEKAPEVELPKPTIQRYRGHLSKPDAPKIENTVLKFEMCDRPELLKQAYKKGYKYILETSPAGSGKTHATGNLRAADFVTKGRETADKLIYAHKQHRSPTTETIERNFAEYPTKHKHLYAHPDKRTPLGNAILMRDADEGSESVLGNCYYAERQVEFYNSHSQISLCKTCKFSAECNTSASPGEYGYLREAKAIGAKSEIRANLQGLNPNLIGDRDVLIIDEYTQSTQFVSSLKITQEDWEQGQPLLKQMLGIHYDLLAPVDRLLKDKYGQIGKFGWSAADFAHHVDVRSFTPLIHYAQAVGEKQEQINLAIATEGGKPCKEWMGSFLRAISNQDTTYSYTFEQNGLTIYSRNTDTLAKIDKFKMAVFLDATSNRQLLALELGVDPEEILVIEAVAPPVLNVTVQQLTSLGTPNKQRSKLKQEQVSILRQHFVRQWGDRVGFIEWKKWAQKGDLEHFVDARGSNLFEKKQAIVTLGMANTNVNAARAGFEVLTAAKCYDDRQVRGSFSFSSYYLLAQRAEIEQEIGRLRAVRRSSESLTYIVVSTFDLSFLQAKGYKYSLIHSWDIDIRLSTTRERIIKAAIDLVRSGNFPKDMSKSELAKMSGCNRKTIARVFRQRYQNVREFVDHIRAMLLEHPEMLIDCINRAVEIGGDIAKDARIAIAQLDRLAADFFPPPKKTICYAGGRKSSTEPHAPYLKASNERDRVYAESDYDTSRASNYSRSTQPADI